MRLMEPLPVELPLLLAEMSWLVPKDRVRAFSRPKRLGTPTDSPPERPPVLSFLRSAVSVMLTRTVTMSPTLAARWSLKKARLPARQRELASAGSVWGRGMGRLMGR